jgi:hypothetical protein
MVLVMVAMSASVYLMYGAVVTDASNIPTAVTFRSSGTAPANVPDFPGLNDTTIDVATTLGNPHIWAPSIEFTIESTQNADVLMTGYLAEEPANISEIYLGVYYSSDSEASIANVWYKDVDANGIISVSDHISVRGMSRQFHGATFRVFASGHQLGVQVIA